MDAACSELLKFFETVSGQNQNLENFSKQLAFVRGIIPFVPSSTLASISRPIVDLCAVTLCSNSSTSTQTVPLLYLLNKVLKCQTDKLLQNLPVGSIFSIWRDFALEEEETDSVKISIRKLIEGIMAKLLNRYEDFGLSAATLILSLQHETLAPGNTVLFRRSGSGPDTDPQFLSSLLFFDSSMFAKKIVHHIEKDNGESGIWDEVIVTLIIQALSPKSCPDNAPSLSFAISALSKRLITIMSSTKDNSFSSIIDAMKSLVVNGRMNHKMFEKILIKSSKFLQTLKKYRRNGMPTEKEMEFIHFLRIAASCKELKNQTPTTIDVVLTHISSSLPKVLKSMHEEICTDLLSIITDVIKTLDTKIVITTKSSVIKRIMVTCLKFGIQSDGAIPSDCLRIVRLLLTALYSENKFDENYKKDLFRPHQLYAMAISHSNFETLAMANRSATRRELISLMITCVALDNSNIMATKWDTFSALLTGFDAGLSEDDCLLRRFLFLYESSVNDRVSALQPPIFNL